MSKPHKDLPGGSQAWAGEVDALMAEVKQLREVIKRLSENAGIDMANPRRGVNVGDTPSIKNPVGQKLSSLADVGSYNVLDGQYLSWNQQGQKWLPVTPLSADGSIDISAVSFSQDRGYGQIVDAETFAYTAASVETAEIWATGQVYIGQGAADFSSMGLIQITQGAFDPWISLMSASPTSSCELLVVDNDVSVSGGTFTIDRCTTANRPTGIGPVSGPSIFDEDLGIPIWWTGTTWINALGTAV